MAEVQETEKNLWVNVKPAVRELLANGTNLVVGLVEENMPLLVGNFEHGLRDIGKPTQPRILGFRVEPSFGIQRKVEIDGEVLTPITPLAYRADLEELGEPLATKVLDCIKTAKSLRRI